MASHPRQKQSQHHISKPQYKKLPRLPNNAQITKRPLLRPAIPSQHSGSQNQKAIYISAKTSFLSAVKRVEKLLHLADKRLVQSATTITKQGQSQSYGTRKRGAGGGEEDEILNVAETVEKLKKRKTDDNVTGNDEGIESGMEEVMLKATGKAIQKCLELGLWFQQREEYRVRLETRSVAAIDDISVDEDERAAVSEAAGESEAADNEDMQVNDDTAAGVEDGCGTEANSGLLRASDNRDKNHKQRKKTREPPEQDDEAKGDVDIPESRIRYASSLEVFVSLR